MARQRNRTIRKEANRGSPAPADTGVGDNHRVRLSPVQSPENEPASERVDNDTLARAKANYGRRIKSYHSTRGRISQKQDLRFQCVVSSRTHGRIRAARRKLKHERFNPSVDIPNAVASDFVALHSCNCSAYEEREAVKRKKESGQVGRKT